MHGFLLIVTNVLKSLQKQRNYCRYAGKRVWAKVSVSVDSTLQGAAKYIS